MRAGGGLLGRIALATTALVVSLAVLELAVRALVAPSASQVLRGLHRTAPERPWLYELVPGATRADATTGVVYAVNGDGFRDRSYPRAKPSGTFRVVVLGDSLSFGYGAALEATFAKQLEARLTSIGGGPRYQVLNLGVSGYNPYTEAELLRGVGLAYAPDLVLAQFCVNDLNDPAMHFDTSTMVALGMIPDDAFPDGTRRARGAVQAAGLARACRWSRLCELVSDALGPGPGDDALIAALAPHENPSPAEVAWLERQYVRMAADTRAHGGQLAVVVFPYGSQLSADAPVRLQEELRALGERAGLLVIDLLPAFRRAAAEPGEPLFLDLWHPTQRGHQVAAQEIFRALACAQMLPGVTARCDA